MEIQAPEAQPGRYFSQCVDRHSEILSFKAEIAKDKILPDTDPGQCSSDPDDQRAGAIAFIVKISIIPVQTAGLAVCCRTRNAGPGQELSFQEGITPGLVGSLQETESFGNSGRAGTAGETGRQKHSNLPVLVQPSLLTKPG